VNPDHLFLGTHRDNAIDRERKRRRIQRTNKLTPSHVRSIRKLREQGLTAASIAALFGVCDQHVYNICQGRSWSYV
jgi:DNA-binding transcriptional regulator YiaG